MLTTAQKYIASRYEQAVGLRHDLDVVRAYLLAHGIKRTPAQVVFDLDETYGFNGYASWHLGSSRTLRLTPNLARKKAP